MYKVGDCLIRSNVDNPSYESDAPFLLEEISPGLWRCAVNSSLEQRIISTAELDENYTVIDHESIADVLTPSERARLKV